MKRVGSQGRELVLEAGENGDIVHKNIKVERVR